MSDRLDRSSTPATTPQVAFAAVAESGGSGAGTRAPGILDRPVSARLRRSLSVWRWEPAILVAGLLAAALTLAVTVRAGFLVHPVLLGIQKADFVLGPLLVGLYWLRVRPASRFGPLLIAYGFVAAVYVTESSTSPWLFTIGSYWELVIYLATEILILTFPTGRLEGLAAKLIVLVSVVGVGLPTTLLLPVFPVATPSFSLSGCGARCPHNPFATDADPQLALDLVHVYLVSVLVVAAATIVLLIWRFVTGTPPRRRALAIGTPLGMLFLATQLLHNSYALFAPQATEPNSIEWFVAGARSLLWYGFWFALIAAQLFAGRALRGLVGESLGRPSFRALEGMLRRPLGDPGLRLGFWRPMTRGWVDTGGTALAPPGPRQTLTEVVRGGRPAAAIVHDAQLCEDPELLQAAGAVALLALENAEIEASWNESLRELAGSRARLTVAGDRERRKLERDLHDGAQQRLMAIQIKLRLVEECVGDRELAARLEDISNDAAEAVEELRTLAHGIYPPALRQFGLVDALSAFAMTAHVPIEIADAGIGRRPRTVEGAIYFCAMEAIQNVTKHAGSHARVTVTLGRDGHHIQFAVADDGVGMNDPSAAAGEGLTSMRDRIGAVGGELEITSALGRGTTVRGTIPVDESAR